MFLFYQSLFLWRHCRQKMTGTETRWPSSRPPRRRRSSQESPAQYNLAMFHMDGWPWMTISSKIFHWFGTYTWHYIQDKKQRFFKAIPHQSQRNATSHLGSNFFKPPLAPSCPLTISQWAGITGTHRLVGNQHVSANAFCLGQLIGLLNPLVTCSHIYIYMHNYNMYYLHLYTSIPGQSLSRIIFDLCGFSGAGLKITFGLRVMDSMTQFWCQKVGLSRLFCVILRHIFGPSKCDWQRAKSAIVRFLVAHYFSVQTKKNAAFGCPGIRISKDKSSPNYTKNLSTTGWDSLGKCPWYC